MYFIGVDLGTSGIKAGIVNDVGEIISSSYWETNFLSNTPGKIEQDPEDFYVNTLGIIKDVLKKSKISPKNIVSISLSGQMGGVIGIDKNFNSITGLDMGLDLKSEEYNDYIHKKYEKLLRKITCGSSRNIPKILWWKNKNPEIYKRVTKFVTISGYIGGKLTGLLGDEAYIDYTTLSFFGGEDILKLDWSERIFKLLDLEIRKMPKVVSPWKVIGKLNKYSSEKCGLLNGTPVVSGAGDQPAGLLGAGVLNPGVMMDVSGSSVLLFMVVDRFKPDMENGSVMYIPSIIPNIFYAFVYINGGGICLKWFKDQFLINNKTDRNTGKNKYDEIEEKVKSIPPGSERLIFIPYFGGRQCPYNRSMRGAWLGLNWGHKKEDMYRAILESIAFEYNIGIHHLIKIFPEYKIERILVTGGGSHSGVWNQIKADVLGIPFVKIGTYEFGLRGLGILAGYGVGAIKDLKNTALNINIEKDKKEFKPNKENKRIYQNFCNIYRDILNNSLNETFHLLSNLQ